jgi:drug/metabolite transporter (DMT)-like permease
MFLGTPRRWWIALGVLFIAGLVLLASGYGGTMGTVGGVLLIFAAMISFAAAPMRYGQNAAKPAPAPPAPPPSLPPPPPGPRPSIEARDSTEV